MPLTLSRHQYRLFLCTVFFLALAVRILCALPAICSPDKLTRPDSTTYLMPAYALAEDGCYAEAPGSDAPAAQRPPGYALFLAGLTKVFGRSLPVFAIAGCLLGAIAVFPTAECGRILAGRTAGVLAAAFYALNLTALSNAPLILADTLLGLLCAFQSKYFIRAWRNRHLSDFLSGAAFAAAAVFVKPVNLPFVLILVPLFLAPVLLGFNRKALAAALLTWLVFAAAAIPWMIRNDRAGAGFVLESNAGMTAIHNTAAILAHRNHSDGDAERHKLEAEAEAVFADNPAAYASVSARNAWAAARFRETILKYPMDAFATHCFQIYILLPDLPNFLQNLGLRTGERGTLAVLRRDGLTAAFRHYMGGSSAAAFLAAPFLLVVPALYALTVVWVYWYAKKKRWRFLGLFAALSAYYLAAPGPVLMPRYQIPALPAACACAGAAWVISAYGIRRWRKRRSCRQCSR